MEPHLRYLLHSYIDLGRDTIRLSRCCVTRIPTLQLIARQPSYTSVKETILYIENRAHYDKRVKEIVEQSWGNDDDDDDEDDEEEEEKTQEIDIW